MARRSWTGLRRADIALHGRAFGARGPLAGRVAGGAAIGAGGRRATPALRAAGEKRRLANPIGAPCGAARRRACCWTRSMAPSCR